MSFILIFVYGRSVWISTFLTTGTYTFHVFYPLTVMSAVKSANDNLLVSNFIHVKC